MPEVMPKRLPILSAKHIFQGDYDGPKGTHCLAGWVCATHMADHHGDWPCLPIAAELGRVATSLGCYGSIPRLNDSHTKAKAASFWNSAVESLGYRKSKSGQFFVLPKKAKA